jgi:hypothetical protein
LVYFSCHGVKAEDGVHHLCMAATTLDQHHSITVDRLVEKLVLPEETRCESILVVLDAGFPDMAATMVTPFHAIEQRIGAH